MVDKRGFPGKRDTLRGEQARRWQIHLDLLPPDGAGPPDELARILALGATIAENQPPDVGWLILADPEGNEFCLEGAGAAE